MRAFFALLLLFSASAVYAATPLDEALSEPLFEPAIDYADIPAIADCKENVRPQRLKYHACKESQAVYDAALKSAKAKDQVLMMVFGFNTCPSCLALDRVMFNPKDPVLNQDIIGFFSVRDIEAYIDAQTDAGTSPVKISTVFIHGRSDHGQQLAHDLGLTDIAKARGWHRVWSPFVVFVNPKTGKMNTEDYWDADEGYCNIMAEYAVNLVKIGRIDAGRPYTERERCAE